MTDPADTAPGGTAKIHFDQHSPEHARNWPAIYRELRDGCPRPFSKDHGGFWVATRYHDVVAVAHCLGAISAHQGIHPETGEMMLGTAIPGIPGTRSVPNETDSPEWDGVRGFLNRWFSPPAAARRAERAAEIARELVDEVIGRGECDLVDDIASPLPGMVTTELFGFPTAEWELYSGPIHVMVSTSPDSPEFAAAAQRLGFFHERVDEEVAKRRDHPREDFLTHLATGTIDGKPLDHQQLHDIAWQILSGGVDTTAAVTANALVYLGRNPEDRRRLAADPGLIPRACEEFVRHFSPIHGAARTVKHDTEIEGWPLAKGDRIYLAYASANRDPAAFVEPEQLQLDRHPNRHVGFGAGQHRCLGSFLAKTMLHAIVGEFLARIPDYEVVEDGIERYPRIGYVNGLVHAPIRYPTP